jgi:16S rRNA (adenine1518-N6/adenine1519-N6)-dimethyltransferase
MLLSNLPYQIGGRLIVELSVGPLAITEMLIMLQKEVAVRLNAAPKTKDYSYLSVITQTFWSVNKVVDASGADFYPQPKVSSRVVSLSRKAIASHFNEDYLNFIKLAFQFRRKFLLKSFRDKDEVLRGSLKELGYKETVRAEEISVLDFQKLYMAVKD